MRNLTTLAVAVVALATAGAAIAAADPGAGVTYGTNAAQPPGGWMDSAGSSGYSYTPSTRQLAANRDAIDGYKLQCAADREALCRHKAWRHAQLRCVEYYRLKVSASCKRALTQVELARRGAL